MVVADSARRTRISPPAAISSEAMSHIRSGRSFAPGSIAGHLAAREPSGRQVRGARAVRGSRGEGGAPLYPRVWLRRDADVRRREEGRAAEGAVLPQAVDECRLVGTCSSWLGVAPHGCKMTQRRANVCRARVAEELQAPWTCRGHVCRGGVQHVSRMRVLDVSWTSLGRVLLPRARRRDDERPRGVSQKGLHGQPRAAVLGD